MQVDYIPLRSIYSISLRQIEPTIEHYLTGVPLTIQSIAYDVDENRIIGEIGIDALQRRLVKVNDLSFAKYYSKKKNKPLQEIIREKADALGFTAIFPE